MKMVLICYSIIIESGIGMFCDIFGVKFGVTEFMMMWWYPKMNQRLLNSFKIIIEVVSLGTRCPYRRHAFPKAFTKTTFKLNLTYHHLREIQSIAAKKKIQSAHTSAMCLVFFHFHLEMKYIFDWSEKE